MATPADTRDSHGLSLTSIPLEVLLQITSNLTTPEYGNFRRTCKHIEETLFPSFAREFFSKRQFMLTEFSLQALVDISKSRLSSSLKHVIFGLERPTMRQYRYRPSASQPDVYVKSNHSRQEYIGHMSLLYTNQDFEMLTEAFSNLCNLETVGIRDFYSRHRNRDYPHNKWKSYGASTYELETGLQLDRPRSFDGDEHLLMAESEYSSRLFLGLLHSLGRAGSRPKDFEITLRTRSLSDHAFNLPKYAEPVVQPVLDNIRTLLLDLNTEPVPVYINGHDEPTACPNYLLRMFLSRLPALEHLRLNFRSSRSSEWDEGPSHLLSWLSQRIPARTSNTTTAKLLPDSPKPIEFAKLSRLDIGMVDVEPKILVDIVEKHRATLRTINLHKLTLMQEAPSGSSHDNLWAEFFAELSKLDLKLTAVKMSQLFQCSRREHEVQIIDFKDSKDHSREWGGTNVQSCLKDFIANVVIEGEEEDSESCQSFSSVGDATPIHVTDVDHESEDDDDF